MSRELWLLRHGKAAHHGQINDMQRALKPAGEQEVRRIALWLAQQTLIPDIVISSPAKRALDTAAIVMDVLGGDKLCFQEDGRLYFQGLDALKTLLSEYGLPINRVLLVGHNPDFEELVMYLTNIGQPEAGGLLPTAALVRLGMPDDWCCLASGCADLLTMIYPKTLPMTQAVGS